MGVAQYRADLHRFEPETKQNLIDLADWAIRDALPWLWQELGAMSPKSHANPVKTHDAIRQGLQTTYADREKMPLELKFYVAQLTMMDSETRRYCQAVQAFAGVSQPPFEDATIQTLHRALASFLNYALILLEQAGHLVLDRPNMYGGWSRRVEHPFEIFKGAEQFIYGSFSWMTHTDRAPFAPIAVLRTAIELRIRSAFGIQGYLDSSNNSFIPIDMSRVLDAVRAEMPKIQFGVDINDVIKIYKWSNFYLHGGWRDFPWVPAFALRYLRPLFVGQPPAANGSGSINSGIHMPREVWRTIRASFDPALEGRWRTLAKALREAIRRFFKPRRRLELNAAEEDAAGCTFTN